jgi:hypothetical protein
MPQGNTSKKPLRGISMEKLSNYTKKNHCIDCDKLICNNAKRCQSCETKRKHKLGIITVCNYKGGLPKCIDCGKELTYYTYKRCSNCWHKFAIGINSPNYGKPSPLTGKNNPRFGRPPFMGKK